LAADPEEGAAAAACGTGVDAAAVCDMRVDVVAAYRSGGGAEDEGNMEEVEAFLVPPVDTHLSIGNVRMIT
jgi:hypothetical protein